MQGRNGILGKPVVGESVPGGLVAGKPVLALDVDGVVSPLGKDYGDELPRYDGWVHAMVTGLPFSYDPLLVEWLHEISDGGVAEIVWSSSWGENSNAVSDEFGLPHLPALDVVSGGRWVAVDEYARGRGLVWCEDARQSAGVRAAVRAREQGSLLVQPLRHLGLTAAQRQLISSWLGEHAGS